MRSFIFVPLLAEMHLKGAPYLRKYVTIELKHLLVTWLFKRAFCKNILMLAGCKFFLHCITCELIKDDCARYIFRFIYPCIRISAGFFRSNICALYEEGISKNWNLPAFNFFLFFLRLSFFKFPTKYHWVLSVSIFLSSLRLFAWYCVDELILQFYLTFIQLVSLPRHWRFSG